MNPPPRLQTKEPSRPQSSNAQIGSLAICMTGIMLGLIPIFKTNLIENFSCTWIVFFRISMAFMCISLLILVMHLTGKRKGKFLISKQHVGSFIGYGAISITAVNYFYIKSLTCTSAAISVITVFAAAPLTTLIANSFVGKETSNKREFSYVMLVITGCLLVNIQPENGNNNADGIIYAIMAGICYGLYSIFGKNVSRDYDYPVMMFWQFAIATVSSVILLLSIDTDKAVTLSTFMSISYKEICSIFGIGFIGTFLPYFLYSFGIKHGVKIVTASALTLLEPVSATALAYLLMNEKINATQAIGIAFVLFFCFMLTKENHKKTTSSLAEVERIPAWDQE